LAAARQLLRAGVRVAVFGRSMEGIAAARLVLGADVISIQGDLRKPTDAILLHREVSASLGVPNILINLIGGDGAIGSLLDLDDATWQIDFEENLFAAVRGDRAVVPGMVKRGSGCVVHISSVAALRPDPQYAPYCAAKAALGAYSMALARELAPKGVICNCLFPGPVDTRQMQSVEKRVSAFRGISPADVRREFERGIATGRYLSPDEVAEAVVWLARDGTRGVVGSRLVIDGGMLFSA
jgi:NAD(P)-dependent dehydrogenase (short-subunit alcohol dehydrogenase family)